MSSPYLGEIRTVGFTFPPVDWMQCNGQLLSISQYDALYSLLGTTYGGDGQNTFALPNLQSRVNVAAGTGSGLSPYQPGATGGTENVTLSTNQLAQHAHPFTSAVNASTTGTATTNPVGNNVYPGPAPGGVNVYSGTPTASATLAAGAITGSTTPAGGSQPHANIQPVLALNCIICVNGLYPPRP
ncbi:MAG: phage tail protein [Cytophagaceae bacterium]|nr:MAG: phage tail protein [Cytophagaceae bacterium]